MSFTNIGSKHVFIQIKNKFIAVSFAFALIILPNSVFSEDLPRLGNPNRLALTSAQEYKMGQDFMHQLYAMGLVLDDPISTDYVQGVGNKLIAASPYSDRKFNFFLINESTINAFAGPGGYIGVNAGLLLATDNESELAGVLAHELAHVTQGHLANQMAEGSKLKKTSLAGMAGAVALGFVNPAAATAALATTMAGAQQHMLNFSRSQEKEADRVGMKTLNNSGYNPHSMIDFFKKLQKQESVFDDIPEILRSHPLTEDRMADAEHRVNEYDNKDYDNPLMYYIVKTRMQLITAEDPYRTLTYFKKNLKEKTYDNVDAMNYGYGITLLAAQQPEKGLQILHQLADKHNDNLVFQMAYAQAALQNDNNELALKQFASTYKAYPDSYPLVVNYAAALYESEKPQQAVDLLQRFILNHPDEEKPYGILSRAQAAAGHKAQAYQTRANFYLSRGDHQQAIDQLNIALRLPDNSEVITKHIKAKISALELEIRDNN